MIDTAQSQKRYDVGIVIPAFNEEDVLPLLRERIAKVMDSFEGSIAVCIVDDGSSDRTSEMLAEFAAQDERFHCLSFSRNFGHQPAIYAGLCELEAEHYFVMDADLQDPPELLDQFLAKVNEGYDVVYGVRRTRIASPVHRFCYWLFYRIMRAGAYIDIPLDAGDYCMMRRNVVLELRRMREHNQFLRGLRTWVGYRQIGLEYDRPDRAAGEAKYSFVKLAKLAYDGLLSFSFRPLKFIGQAGVLLAAIAFLMAVVVILQKLIFDVDVQGWASLIVVVLFLGGIQLITLGVMSEYIARIFDEVKDRPLYIVRTRKGSSFESEE